MWESQIEKLSRGSVHRVALLQDGASVSFAEVVDHWRGDEPFRAFFAESPADAPFEATCGIVRSASVSIPTGGSKR